MVENSHWGSFNTLQDTKLELQDCQDSRLSFLEPALYSQLTISTSGFARFCTFCFLRRASCKTQSLLCKFATHSVFFHNRLQSLEPALEFEL
ncbi:hypothetical protein SLEP1_g17241 [Rubroshorea leprosula]|uniref:Uncharacterized protein n=1 Tax=Rubroshorea leprosula TaxID=152421 RepID=A0AAV5ITN5_9ROSI|nr:hypothetical protein SLEP1_g17241 [Rubroshorea leprosula]